MRRFIWFYLLFLLLAVSGAYAVTAGEAFTDELDAAQYDCTVVLTPPRAETATRLLLEADAGGKGIHIILARQAIHIEGFNAKGAVAMAPGAAFRLLVLRRGPMLYLLHQDAVVARAAVPHGPGALGQLILGKGWILREARAQRLEPVLFADNFMRSANEAGGWAVRRGAWGLLSAWDRDPKGGYLRFKTVEYAQNPFAWSGKASADNASALCTAGQPYWEDYTFTAAVCPAAGGAAGLMVNLADPAHGLLLRWSPVNDLSPTGDRLLLYRVNGEKRELLAESRGGYLPGQWYKVAVRGNLDGLSVSIDHRERLALQNVTPWRGGVGLYTEGPHETIFDDVTVYGRGIGQDLLAEHHAVQLSARFQEDKKGMAEWAASGNDWRPHPAAPGLRLHRWDFFGDHWLSLAVTPADGDGTLELALNGDGKDPAGGCRAVLKQEGGKLACALLHDTKVLARKSLSALTPKTAYGVRLRRDGAALILEIDGESVLRANAAGTGLRPAYRAEGAFAAVSEIAVVGRQVLDDTFADAPTDWLTEGTWMPTTRWSCSPQWSFLGGWSRGDAVLWHKQRFTGDQSFEVFMAPKMEYPRERRTYEYHFRDLAVTICGDGRNPRSGYAAIYGQDGARTVLLRDGVEVAAVPGVAPFYQQGGHTAWYGIGLHKRGATIELAINRKTVLTYTDPKPIDGGVPAVWTGDNGIAIARARLHYANPPVPRTDPQVALDTPWHPDWAEKDRPLTLAFPGAMATSGKPVRLQVTARDVPPGETAPAVAGTAVTITPTMTGEHWYQIQATDGATTSPAYHVALPVFTPALGRDDSRALVLYRFDEAGGKVIHDRAAVAPAADLTIPDDATVQWLPGQGLTLRGVNHIRTAGHVGKLTALAKSRAATFEFWLTADTIYPPSDWHGYLLTWEKPGAPAQNLAIAQISSKIMLIPDGTLFVPRGNFVQDTMQTCAIFPGYRTGLQHLVFTWDGRVTRAYNNGVKVGERTTPWKPEGWTPDAPLTLGNHLNPQERNFDRYIKYLLVAPYILKDQGTGEHAFLGTFYLTAIHDRCFTDADVARHFGAGPGAR